MTGPSETSAKPDLSAALPWLPWLALAIGFSPVLAGLAVELWGAPPSRPALLAPLLLLLALRRGAGEVAAGRWDGLALLAFGVLLEALGIAGGTPWVAQAGLPVAVLGLARLRGWPPLLVAALALFALPTPMTLAGVTSPQLERLLARLALLPAEAIGAPLEVRGQALSGPAGQIPLGRWHGGAHLVPMLAGLGWYAGLRAGAGLGGCAIRAALAAALSVPAQLAGLVVAVALLAAGSPRGAAAWLSHGVWLVAAVVGLAWVHRRRGPGRRSSRAGRPQASG